MALVYQKKKVKERTEAVKGKKELLLARPQPII